MSHGLHGDKYNMYNAASAATTTAAYIEHNSPYAVYTVCATDSGDKAEEQSAKQ